MPPSASRSARNVWNARQRGQLTKGAAGRRAARRRTSRRSTSSKTCHRAGVWRKLFSSPIGAVDEMRFVIRSLGTISAICQRARRRHRRSARLVCGTGPRRQAAHVSHSSRVVRRIRGAGCRARPHRASEAKRRGRSRSRAAQKGSAHFCTMHFAAVRSCGRSGARRDLPLRASQRWGPDCKTRDAALTPGQQIGNCMETTNLRRAISAPEI